MSDHTGERQQSSAPSSGLPTPPFSLEPTDADAKALHPLTGKSYAELTAYYAANPPQTRREIRERERLLEAALALQPEGKEVTAKARQATKKLARVKHDALPAHPAGNDNVHITHTPRFPADVPYDIENRKPTKAERKAARRAARKSVLPLPLEKTAPRSAAPVMAPMIQRWRKITKSNPIKPARATKAARPRTPKEPLTRAQKYSRILDVLTVVLIFFGLAGASGALFIKEYQRPLLPDQDLIALAQTTTGEITERSYRPDICPSAVFVSPVNTEERLRAQQAKELYSNLNSAEYPRQEGQICIDSPFYLTVDSAQGGVVDFPVEEDVWNNAVEGEEYAYDADFLTAPSVRTAPPVAPDGARQAVDIATSVLVLGFAFGVGICNRRRPQSRSEASQNGSDSPSAHADEDMDPEPAE